MVVPPLSLELFQKGTRFYTNSASQRKLLLVGRQGDVLRRHYPISRKAWFVKWGSFAK